MHADFNELNPLCARLSGLPAFAPPAGGWEAAQARHAARMAGRGPASRLAPSRLAMAASLLAMLAAGLLSAGGPGSVGAEPPLQAAPPLDGLVAENARLEAVLAGLPRSRSTRAGTAYTVAVIEDRLALLDDRITAVALEPHAPEAAEDLWRDRVALMNSLVQVQYASLVASR